MSNTLHVLRIALIDEGKDGEVEWFVNLKGKVSYDVLVNTRDASKWQLRAVASGRRPAPGAFRGILVPSTHGATLANGDKLEVLGES